MLNIHAHRANCFFPSPCVACCRSRANGSKMGLASPERAYFCGPTCQEESWAEAREVRPHLLNLPTLCTPLVTHTHPQHFQLCSAFTRTSPSNTLNLHLTLSHHQTHIPLASPPHSPSPSLLPPASTGGRGDSSAEQRACERANSGGGVGLGRLVLVSATPRLYSLRRPEGHRRGVLRL